VAVVLAVDVWEDAAVEEPEVVAEDVSVVVTVDEMDDVAVDD
jgi:hypothetical protein